MGTVARSGCLCPRRVTERSGEQGRPFAVTRSHRIGMRVTTLLAVGGLVVTGGLLTAVSPVAAAAPASNVAVQQWHKIGTVNFSHLKAAPAASARAAATA